jgi:hypothetical protein
MGLETEGRGCCGEGRIHSTTNFINPLVDNQQPLVASNNNYFYYNVNILFSSPIR